MSRARDIADLSSVSARLDTVGGSEGALSNRNLVINGAMQVAQRGTSKTTLGNGDNGYHTVDRWRFSESGSPTGEFTMSQSTDAPDGFAYSMKFDCTTADTAMAAGDRFQVSTRIEAQNAQHLKYGTSDAKTLSLSFWVKSNKTGTYCIGLVQPDNSSISFVREYTISSSNTWEYKTLTIDGDTTGSIANDTGNGLELGFSLAAGSNFHETPDTWTGSYEYSTSNQVNLADSTSNEWYLTGVQLEVGDTATDFEHRSYGQELALCQRYYYEISGNSSLVGHGFYYGSNEIDVLVNFPVPMRTSPTLTSSNNTNDFVFQEYTDTFNTWNGIQYYNGDSLNMFVYSGVSGTGGQAGYARTNTSTGKLQFSSEL